jgi:hypothetical protein
MSALAAIAVRARGEKGTTLMANAPAKLIERAEVWVEPQLKRRIDGWKDKPGGMRDALDLYDRLQRYPVLKAQIEFELVSREEQARHPAMNGQHHQAAE